MCWCRQLNTSSLEQTVSFLGSSIEELILRLLPRGYFLYTEPGRNRVRLPCAPFFPSLHSSHYSFFVSVSLSVESDVKPLGAIC